MTTENNNDYTKYISSFLNTQEHKSYEFVMVWDDYKETNQDDFDEDELEDMWRDDLETLSFLVYGDAYNYVNDLTPSEGYIISIWKDQYGIRCHVFDDNKNVDDNLTEIDWVNLSLESQKGIVDRIKQDTNSYESYGQRISEVDSKKKDKETDTKNIEQKPSPSNKKDKNVQKLKKELFDSIMNQIGPVIMSRLVEMGIDE